MEQPTQGVGGVVGGNRGVGTGDGSPEGPLPAGRPLQLVHLHKITGSPRDARHLAHLSTKRGGENENRKDEQRKRRWLQETRPTAPPSTYCPCIRRCVRS